MLPDDPDSQARFFYLALLGMVIASGLFGMYRHRLGAAMQHAAIWVLIFLGATLAVGFWEPLLSQLLPERAVQTGSGGIALRRASDGHFHADVAVNGTPVRFLVDTGASSVVLSRDDAARAGIDVEKLEFLIEVRTANGTARAARVRLDSIALGGLEERGMTVLVNGGDSARSLLGMDYLDRFRSIRIEDDRLILER
ncbi:MAG TPA: TIGR02281 family clan AA aspartic protease [Thermohalobaculum sp.]|nr:TIGR02281 family clan AA aspartic protease [Thermohalobaculum sp.]